MFSGFALASKHVQLHLVGFIASVHYCNDTSFSFFFFKFSGYAVKQSQPLVA
jgi:hypothetical protein